MPAAGAPHLEALTDAEGRYEFAGLEPGDYGVVATAGDLRATHLRQAFGRPEPLDPFSSPPRSGVTLEPGERRTGVNIVLALALAIEGRVFDSWDEPMAEVDVSLSRADGTPPPGRGFRSDDRGEYRAFGLAPGRYRVCAAPQRSGDVASDASRFVQTCHPSAIAVGDAADVILTSSDVSGIDIRVQRSRTFTVSGSVTDAAGSTVDTPHVMAVSFDRRGDSAYARGSEGRFVLRGLTPGRYLLKASVGGPENADDTRPPAREEEVGYSSVDVVTTDVAGGVTIQLSKGRTLTGRVAFEGGLPVPASQLRMAVHTRFTGSVWASSVGRNPPVSAVSDTLSFELKGLYQLPLTIDVTGLPDGWAVKSVRFDGQDITTVPTNFGDSTKSGLLEILATSRVASPSVRVSDDRGDAPSSCQVVLFSTNPSLWTVPPRWRPEPARDGVVKLGPILPGEYFVAVLTGADFSMLANDVTRLADLAPVAARVTFFEGDVRTLEMKVTPLPAASGR